MIKAAKLTLWWVVFLAAALQAVEMAGAMIGWWSWLESSHEAQMGRAAVMLPLWIYFWRFLKET